MGQGSEGHFSVPVEAQVFKFRVAVYGILVADTVDEQLRAVSGKNLPCFRAAAVDENLQLAA